MLNLLILYYWIITLYNPEILNVNMSTIYLFLVMAMSAVLVFSKRRVHLNCPKPLVAFIVICFVYSIPFGSFSGDVAVWIRIAIPAFLILIINNLYHSNLLSAFQKLANGIGVSNWLACAVGLLTYFSGSARQYTANIGGVTVLRMTGSFQQANVFSSYIGISFTFGIYAACNITRVKRKWLIVVVSLANTICLVLSFSRWAIISLIGSAIIYYITVYGIRIIKANKHLLPLVVAAAISALLILMINSKSIWSGLQSFFIHEGSTEIRSSSMLNAINASADNLFFGMGMGVLPSNILILDSSVMNILVDTGIIGLIVFLIFILQTWKRLLFSLRTGKESLIECKMVYFSFLVFMINSVAESVVYNILINSFIAMYVVAIYAFEHEKNTNIQLAPNNLKVSNISKN